MMHAPTVSVIICAYTEARWHDLIEAVASLRRQHYAPAQVIVVVDHNPGAAGKGAGGVPRRDGNREHGTAGAFRGAQQRAGGGRRRYRGVHGRGCGCRALLAAGTGGSVRRSQRAGGGRRNRAAVAERAPGLVPGGVRLGGRLHVPGHARDTGAGAQPDRLQHVAAAGGICRGGRVPAGHRPRGHAAGGLRGDGAVHSCAAAVAPRRVGLRAHGRRTAPRARRGGRRGDISAAGAMRRGSPRRW